MQNILNNYFETVFKIVTRSLKYKTHFCWALRHLAENLMSVCTGLKIYIIIVCYFKSYSAQFYKKIVDHFV